MTCCRSGDEQWAGWSVTDSYFMVCKARWAKGEGRAMGGGRWEVVGGKWEVVGGRWEPVDGRWAIRSGRW